MGNHTTGQAALNETWHHYGSDRGDRLARIAALRAWEHRLERGTASADLHFDLGVAATDLRAWGLARDCFEAVIAARPECASGHFNLSVCCRMLGNVGRAHEYAVRARDCAATRDRERLPACQQLLDELALQQARLPPWFEPGAFRDGEVELQPLQEHHTSALFEALQEPNLARLTGLERLASEENFASWCAERIGGASRTRAQGVVLPHSLAIVHQEFGVVGCVNLQQVDRCATFSFWVSAAFRGRGCGTRALRILFALAPHAFGIDDLFTAVRSDNFGSRRLLRRCQWARLSLNGKGPVPVDYYHWKLRGAHTTGSEALRASLAELLRSIRSDFSLEDEQQGAANRPHSFHA